MKTEEFQSLLDAMSFQVFLFSAPLPMPINFAVHCWFVININGQIERWEFGRFVHSPHPKKIGVLKNFISPVGGMRKYPWKTKKGTRSRLVNHIKGKENSLAHKMALFIQEETPNYPLRNRYVLTGPNSNTYVQWVINHFPESGFALPWRAIGQGWNKFSRLPDNGNRA